MKAMILAAGRGERLRPLTDTLPKPLVPVGGEALISRHLRALARAGFSDVVVNLAYGGDRIRAELGEGDAFGLRIHYQDEGEHALDTGGGLRRALPLLGNQPFLAVNADVFTDYPLGMLGLPAGRLAHLVLVDNPPHRPDGDFALDGERVTERVTEAEGRSLTFTGIGVYHPELFAGRADGVFPLAPLLYEAIRRGMVSGEHYTGLWLDVGTPERLEQADALAGQQR